MNGFRSIFESRALADVLAERMNQVDLRGHTPQADAEHPPHRLPDLASQYARIAADRARPGERQNLSGARKKAVQAAALAIAAVEQLDQEIERRRQVNSLSLDFQFDDDLPGLIDAVEASFSRPR